MGPRRRKPSSPSDAGEHSRIAQGMNQLITNGPAATQPAAPSPTAAGHDITPAFVRLDLRLRQALDEFRQDIARRAADPLWGLCISDADIDRLLADMAPGEAARRLLLAPAGAVAPRLAALARSFGLSPIAQDAVLICLAPELDLRYERLYAYLQDDIARKRPTVDLVVRLLAASLSEQIALRAELTPAAPLFRNRILTLADPSADRMPLLARPLKLQDRIVEYLLGSDALDSQLDGYVELLQPAPLPGLEPADTTAARLRAILTSGNASEPQPAAPLLIYVHGQTPAARLRWLHTVASSAGQPLLLLHAERLPLPGEAEPLIGAALREALLHDAIPVIGDLHELMRAEAAGALSALRRQLTDHQGPTVLLGEQRWEPAAWLPSIPAVRMQLPPVTLANRSLLWQEAFAGELAAEALADLAGRYRLDHAGIAAVRAAGWLLAKADGRATLAADDVRAAARAVSAPPMEGLAQRIQPRHAWADIVLPADGLAQLREICARSRHQQTVLETWDFGRKHAARPGILALFAGQPGTGKTMGAQILAAELGLELFRIDLAAIVSKYIGETEKNLDRIFSAAEQGDAVLLFDEADALFGKRSDVKDAHDRYANVEVAYLLQRLETYQGIAVLTTNLRGNLDDAFLRRLDFGVDFPMPEEAERLKIWQLSIPEAAPVSGDIDLLFLARKLKLAGGHIRNIAVAAAFLAADHQGPITMADLVRATKREYQKLGKLIREADFEQYYDLLREA